MKTKYYLLLIAFAFALNSNAQLLNGGFEDWTNNGSYSDPDHWFSLNYVSSTFSVLICEEGTPGNPGSKYVKLTSRTVGGLGVISGTLTSGSYDNGTGDYIMGFPFTQRPASLTGSWQYMPGAMDQGTAYVLLTKWNTTTQVQDLIAINSYALPGSQTTWANFDLPLTYISTDFPDSASIYFSSSGASSGSPVDGSYLYVDNLAFAGTASGISNTPAPLTIDLFPNPANQFFYIAKSNYDKETKYEIASIDGKIVQTGVAIGATTKVELKNVASGVYLVHLFNEGAKITRKIIIQ